MFRFGKTQGAGVQVSLGASSGDKKALPLKWTRPSRIARDISTPPEYGSFSKGDVAVWAFAIVASKSTGVMSKKLIVRDALVKIHLHEFVLR